MSAETGRPPARDAEPRDLLNAYLDGELDDEERALVDRALVASPALCLELDELRSTQAMLRALPLVEQLGVATPQLDAPVVSIDRRRRRRRRTVVGAAIGAIAAGLLVMMGVGATLDPMPIAPSIDEFASVHMGSADSLGDFDDMDADLMGDPAVLADLGDGMDRTAVHARDDLVHTVYSDGSRQVSVFHEPGVVDWDALPGDGSMTEDGATKTWTGVRDQTVVAVAERGDLMVVIVADVDADADIGSDEAWATAMHAVEMVPPVDVERGLWDRLSEAPTNLIDRI